MFSGSTFHAAGPACEKALTELSTYDNKVFGVLGTMCYDSCFLYAEAVFI